MQAFPFTPPHPALPAAGSLAVQPEPDFQGEDKWEEEAGGGEAGAPAGETQEATTIIDFSPLR